MKNSCREYTLPRSEPESRPRGWILGNTKIDLVLDVKVCFHQKRYGIEIMIESQFRDRTVPWVRIVNGINKYVTETSETLYLEIFEHKEVTGKLVATRAQNSNGETCCEGQTATQASCDTVSCLYSYSWKKMDRH